MILEYLGRVEIVTPVASLPRLPSMSPELQEIKKYHPEMPEM